MHEVRIQFDSNERLLRLAAVCIFPQPLQPPNTISRDAYPRYSSGLRLPVFVLDTGGLCSMVHVLNPVHDATCKN